MNSNLWLFLSVIMVGVNIIGMTTDTGNVSAVAQGSLGLPALQGAQAIWLTSFAGQRSSSGGLLGSSVRPSSVAVEGAMLHLVERDPNTNVTAVSEQTYTVTENWGVAGVGENDDPYSYVIVSPALVKAYPAGTLVVTSEFVEMNGLRRLSLVKPRGDILGVRIPVLSPLISGVKGGYEKVDSVWTTAKRMITLDYAMFNIGVAPMTFLQLAMQAVQYALGVRLGILIISLVRGA